MTFYTRRFFFSKERKQTTKPKPQPNKKKKKKEKRKERRPTVLKNSEGLNDTPCPSSTISDSRRRG